VSEKKQSSSAISHLYSILLTALKHQVSKMADAGNIEAPRFPLLFLPLQENFENFEN